MNKWMIAAAASGSGKTAVTCGLLAALRKRGQKVCAFKCGPDYIDPMFHRAVLGVESHNLDLFLSDGARVRELFQRYSQGCDTAICEGVMGYYDGLGGVTDQGSAWQVADTLRLPVLLVLRPRGASLTLAAQVRGLCQFRSPHHIAGILLNDCPPMLFQSLGPMLERETSLPVLGYLPPMEEAAIASRHLGLYTAAEIEDITARLDRLAAQMEKTVDIDRLLSLGGFGEESTAFQPRKKRRQKSLRLAVARDRAFCFAYAETLDTLEAAGMELVFFSPLADSTLPEGVHGLYLPGGYPELHAKELAANGAMRKIVKAAVESGLPTVAECGGFLYLCDTLEDAAGVVYPMAGVLPNHGFRTEKLVRFGYGTLTAREDSLLFEKGDTLPIHSFHYWDTSQRGEAFAIEKPIGGRSWQCGFANDTLYAAFPHLYFAGHEKPVERLAAAMENYKNKRYRKRNSL